jgi:hypothetical protein
VLKKPIEIVNSQVESPTGTTGAAAMELIKFTVKAELAGAPKPAAGKGRGAKK